MVTSAVQQHVGAPHDSATVHACQLHDLDLSMLPVSSCKPNRYSLLNIIAGISKVGSGNIVISACNLWPEPIAACTKIAGSLRCVETVQSTCKYASRYSQVVWCLTKVRADNQVHYIGTVVQ